VVELSSDACKPQKMKCKVWLHEKQLVSSKLYITYKYMFCKGLSRHFTFDLAIFYSALMKILASNMHDLGRPEKHKILTAECVVISYNA